LRDADAKGVVDGAKIPYPAAFSGAAVGDNGTPMIG
jgi:hypothetical protein